MLNWKVKRFDELSLDEFHDVIQLRIQVFVVEQDCPYQDLDGLDKKTHHVLGTDDKGNILATARILPPGLSYPQIAIGRVVVDERLRKSGQGHELMKQTLGFIEQLYGKNDLILSAQKHLEKYYEAHGFLSTGKEYLEDGIPHVQMISKI
ncbi:MAG: ElaA protein [Lentimonas sp.]|jgi:ElaA protein